MHQPDHASLLAVDSAEQMRKAAKSMRDLALGLEQYASDPCFTTINQIGQDLNRIGWNTLYASQLMSDLADAMGEDHQNQDEGIKADAYRFYLDALLTAINYFSRSIIYLKRLGKSILDDEEIKPRLAEVYERLKEVTRECRSF
jgi:hypothetical protein